MKSLPLLLVAASFCLGGCVLPIPTSKVAAPSIHGRVTNAHTGAPVDMAGVVVKGFKEASVLTARDGSFKTDQITRTQMYWLWWPFGSDALSEVELRVARPGFHKEGEKVQWNPKTQREVVLPRPIALTPKSKEKLKDEVLKRLGNDTVPEAPR